MITLKSAREIDAMARAGRIVAGTLALMRTIVRPGLSTEDLDRAAEEFIRSHEGATRARKLLANSSQATYLDGGPGLAHK